MRAAIDPIVSDVAGKDHFGAPWRGRVCVLESAQVPLEIGRRFLQRAHRCADCLGQAPAHQLVVESLVALVLNGSLADHSLQGLDIIMCVVIVMASTRYIIVN